MSIVLLDKTKCILTGAEGGELILCTHVRVREVHRRMIRGAYRSDTGHGINTPWQLKHRMLIGKVKNNNFDKKLKKIKNGRGRCGVGHEKPHRYIF